MAAFNLQPPTQFGTLLITAYQSGYSFVRLIVKSKGCVNFNKGKIFSNVLVRFIGKSKSELQKNQALY